MSWCFTDINLSYAGVRGQNALAQARREQSGDRSVKWPQPASGIVLRPPSGNFQRPMSSKTIGAIGSGLASVPLSRNEGKKKLTAIIGISAGQEMIETRHLQPPCTGDMWL